jgi:hypothetical protein
VKLFGEVEIIVSPFVPEGKAFLIAQDLSEEDNQRIAETEERYVAGGMDRIKARLLALAESGKVAAIHLGPNTLADLDKDPSA